MIGNDTDFEVPGRDRIDAGALVTSMLPCKVPLTGNLMLPERTSTMTKILLVIGSFCCGAGASLLWNGIGVVLTALSNQKTRGRRAGLFAFLNRLNFTSNVMLGGLLAAGIRRGELFIFLFSYGPLLTR